MVQTKNELIKIPDERVINKIFTIREKKVMLDRDLAELYGVTTGNLNKAVKRNIYRFPDDFMFQLTKKELENLVLQFGISGSSFQFGILKQGKNIKYLPYVFTEQGVAMLSSILSSKRAVAVNIQIIRTFTKLRELLATNAQLRKKIEDIEEKYDENFSQVFKVLKLLLKQEDERESKEPIGFA